MIEDAQALQEWEDAYAAAKPVDYLQNLAIVESLLQLAIEAGTFPPADPMEGIDVKIRMAKILNCSKNSYKPLPARLALKPRL